MSRKKSIIAASAVLFRNKGYSATTMRDIARELGIEAASLYNHIPSKQQILSELLMDIAQLFTEGMVTILASSASPLEQLEKLIAMHVQLTINHTDAISLIPSEWVHLEEPNLKEFVLLRDKYEKDFRTLMQAAVDAGELDIVDLDLAVFTLLSTLRWLYSWYSKYQPEDASALESELTRYLIKGIAN